MLLLEFRLKGYMLSLGFILDCVSGVSIRVWDQLGVQVRLRCWPGTKVRLSSVGAYWRKRIQE